MDDVLNYCKADVLSTQSLYISMHNADIQYKIDAIYDKLKDCDDLALRGIYARKILRLKSKLLGMDCIAKEISNVHS